MKLYYHKTDGGAEYYCLDNVAHTHPDNPYFKDATDEGDMETAVLRTDGNEFELYTERIAQAGIKIVFTPR